MFTLKICLAVSVTFFISANLISLIYILVVPTDCIVEGEVLKLGGPFLQSWQKKHLKLYPNRLEFYHKSRDGQVVRGKNVEVIYTISLFLLLQYA